MPPQQRQQEAAAQASPKVTLVGSVLLVPAALILILVGAFFGMDLDIDLEALTGGI